MSSIPFLQSKSLSINWLFPAPWNFKAEGDDSTKRRLVESLRRGVTPLHVAQYAEKPEGANAYEVCDGNHRLGALRSLGVRRVRVYDHGRLALAERKEIAVRYNVPWFAIETVPLAECLQELDAILDVPEALPIDDIELSRLLATLNVDLSAALGEGGDDDDDGAPGPSSVPKATVRKARDVTTVTCPHCGKTFNL